MTRDQIAVKIRENLNDHGITYYSSEDLNDSIQDAYDEIVVYTECIEKITKITLPGDSTYYNFATLIPDFYRLMGIHNPEINAYLTPDTDRNQLNYRNNWETITGSARDFTILDYRYIGIAGRSSYSRTFKIYYKAQAPTLSGSTSLLINSHYQILVEHYCTADLLEQNQEFNKAVNYWALYEHLLEDYKFKIKLLSKADRIFTRTQDAS